MATRNIQSLASRWEVRRLVFPWLPDSCPNAVRYARKVKLEKTQEYLHGNDTSPQKREARTRRRLSACRIFLTCFLQLMLAGTNTADGVRNFVFGSSVVTWKRSNRPFLFPPPLPLSNVRRYWLLRCVWISSKYGLRLMGSPKPRQYDLAPVSSESRARLDW